MCFEFILEKDVCISLYFLIPKLYLDSIVIVSMMRFMQQVFHFLSSCQVIFLLEHIEISKYLLFQYIESWTYIIFPTNIATCIKTISSFCVLFANKNLLMCYVIWSTIYVCADMYFWTFHLFLLKTNGSFVY